MDTEKLDKMKSKLPKHSKIAKNQNKNKKASNIFENWHVKVVRPNDLKNAFGNRYDQFSGRNQEDAQECFVHLMRALDEELELCLSYYCGNKNAIKNAKKIDIYRFEEIKPIKKQTNQNSGKNDRKKANKMNNKENENDNDMFDFTKEESLETDNDENMSNNNTNNNWSENDAENEMESDFEASDSEWNEMTESESDEINNRKNSNKKKTESAKSRKNRNNNNNNTNKKKRKYKKKENGLGMYNKFNENEIHLLSPIRNNFAFELANVFKCKECGHSRTITETFFELALDFPKQKEINKLKKDEKEKETKEKAKETAKKENETGTNETNANKEKTPKQRNEEQNDNDIAMDKNNNRKDEKMEQTSQNVAESMDIDTKYESDENQNKSNPKRLFFLLHFLSYFLFLVSYLRVCVSICSCDTAFFRLFFFFCYF